MSGVSERLAGAPIQGSYPMAAEFLSAARVPDTGCSPQRRKPSRLKQEVQTAEMPQHQNETQVGSLKPCSVDSANTARGQMLIIIWWSCMSKPIGCKPMHASPLAEAH